MRRWLTRRRHRRRDGQLEEENKAGRQGRQRQPPNETTSAARDHYSSSSSSFDARNKQIRRQEEEEESSAINDNGIERNHQDDSSSSSSSFDANALLRQAASCKYNGHIVDDSSSSSSSFETDDYEEGGFIGEEGSDEDDDNVVYSYHNVTAGSEYDPDGWLKEWPDIRQQVQDYYHESSPFLPTQQERATTSRQLWASFDGPRLEPALRSQAIALLNGRWIVEYYYQHYWMQQQTNVVLPFRQELPPEAFCSVDQLKASLRPHDNMGLHIYALSYMWLQPDHPDPKGTTLRLVAEECRRLLSIITNQGWCPVIGVFWDYASLHQHPNPAEGIYRSVEENELFKEGLGALAALYSHPHTNVLKVTQFPNDGCPHGYNLPSQLEEHCNQAAYMDRGWPFMESSLTGLVKVNRMVHDLSAHGEGFRVQQQRRSPITPHQMVQELQQKKFTNQKEDFPIVAQLYTREFERCMSTLVEMDYSQLGWDDFEVEHLAEIIQQGHVPQLQVLDVSDNQFRWHGCAALADALLLEDDADSSGEDKNVKSKNNYSLRVPLQELNLGDTPIGDEGMENIAKVLVQVPKVDLRCCQLGVAACQHLATAAKDQYENKQSGFLVKDIHLMGNKQIGNTGIAILADMLVRLEIVNLHDMDTIRPAACQSLAQAASKCIRNKTFRLQELHLWGSPIGDLGMEYIADTFLSMQNVQLTSCGISVLGCQSLAKAAKRRLKKGKTSKSSKTKITLRNLSLFRNNLVCSDGLIAIAPLLVSPSMQEVNLFDCNIDDEGCKALADAAERNCPSLKSFSIGDNYGIKRQGYIHLCRFISKCPKLEEFRFNEGDWDEYREMIKAASLNPNLET